MERGRLVRLAVVTGAHGVRGHLRLHCFTDDPASVAAYGTLRDERGEALFDLEVLSPIKGGVIARAAGITDRDVAQALKGTELFVARERLPEPEADEFYADDLIGLAVRDPAGRHLGEVVAVHDFGAGEIIEYRDTSGRLEMVPFTGEHVPQVDLASGLVVDLPDERAGAAEPRESAA